MTIIAHDDEGRTFEKTVTAEKGTSGPVVSFGGWCRYYIEDLEQTLTRVLADTGTLEGREFNLDTCGRNHKGSRVFIPLVKLEEALDWARKALEK